MHLDETVDPVTVGGRRQDEGEHLDQVPLRDIALDQLPVEDYDMRPKAHVALVEVIVRQCRGKPVLDRMPVR